ncbi:hypothetical protein DM02DRAFT_656572 [Periconia macrospinosa]|uniref:Thioesterase domain-containing protein n=1 Tax=Periconia macrospinosa TaxID=97972 RepID=A0A2V1DM18_9PLEO|nr:hypothetical protein DM02DRAFT_656572 [Periconia macrospinosa]
MNRVRFSTIRPLLRTHESTTHWVPRRFAQTKTSPIANATPVTKLGQPRRLRTAYLWYGLVFAVGSAVGFTIRNFAAPSPLPLPGSQEDAMHLEALNKDVEDLEIVKYMRSQSLPLRSETNPPEQPADSASESRPKKWVEVDIKTNVTESEDEASKHTRTITFQSMAGYRGLGVQRAFWNPETKELVAVVWIGTALSGWPGLAHGGAIATIFEDCMARMIAGPTGSVDTVALPTSMGVTYAKPTHNSSFYIIRASFSKPKLPQTEPPTDPEPAPAKSWLPFWKDFTKKQQQPTEEKKTVEIIGTLESIQGELCVRAKGTFPVENTLI